ncbi:MAG: FHA domain-containing serine/threonine-protein kinase [Thermoanaerobaculia bacterium]
MIGNVIGNYRIERELSEGGMSHVYVGRTVARSEMLPEGFVVVLKIMSDELAGEVTARKRFVKEAQILAKLRHRYITRFYEFLPRSTGAVLVMEFVEGDPVDQMISDRGALPIPEAIAISQCLLEALVYAHGKGIVHRDIKPANLIRQKNGVVKVSDFGIAKIKESGAQPGTILTKSGFLLGTPHYMSPEQIREPKDAGPPSDVYSSGVVLYEMLTGVLPFNSRSLPKLIDSIYRGEKQHPRALRPEIDHDLDGIVLRAIEPNPANRFATAREMYEALEEYCARPALTGSAIPPEIAEAASEVKSEPRHVPANVESVWQLVSTRDEASEAHVIHGDSVMVGRDRSCSIILTHPAVSRRHARITLQGTGFFLEDLKSANGTYVNNMRVEKANLKPGDIVRFGADPACSYVLRTRPAEGVAS